MRRCRVVTSLLTVGLRASLTTVVCAGSTMGLLVVRRLLVSTAAIVIILSVAALLSISTLLLVTALVVAGAVVSRHDVVYEGINLDSDD